MIKFNITIPRAVKNEPRFVQQAYIREFHRIEEQTGDILTAKHGADLLLTQLRNRASNIKANAEAYHRKMIEENMAVNIIAHISEMSASECIPPDVLNDIKAKDPHPYFAVWDIGGEGVSTGLVNRSGRAEKKIWSFSAIKELASKIKSGVAGVIHGHNIVFGNDLKKKGGQIIHAFTKTIQNSLHAIAVSYITDKTMIDNIESGKLDLCSIEGNVVLARDDPNGNWFVKTVNEIKNLALGSSTVESAGFNSAGILATIQELTERDQGE